MLQIKSRAMFRVNFNVLLLKVDVKFSYSVHAWLAFPFSKSVRDLLGAFEETLAVCRP